MSLCHISNIYHWKLHMWQAGKLIHHYFFHNISNCKLSFIQIRSQDHSWINCHKIKFFFLRQFFYEFPSSFFCKSLASFISSCYFWISPVVFIKMFFSFIWSNINSCDRRSNNNSFDFIYLSCHHNSHCTINSRFY